VRRIVADTIVLEQGGHGKTEDAPKLRFAGPVKVCPDWSGICHFGHDGVRLFSAWDETSADRLDRL